MTEDTRIGGVTWHSSEDFGGPDVGVSIYLGDYLGHECRVWCGEISRKLYDDCHGDDHFDSDGGKFIIWYKPAPELIAKVADEHQARLFIEYMASLATSAQRVVDRTSADKE